MFILRQLSAKAFVWGFIIIILTSFGLSFFLYELDLPYTDNDIIRRYQLNKIQQSPQLDTIIVGDSSAGNAIDAELFSNQTGWRVANLALTRSFGLEGSYNLMRQAIKKHPIRNVIIIQSPTTLWSDSFSEQGLAETLGDLPLPSRLPGNISRWDFFLFQLKSRFNMKELVWFVKYLLHPPTVGIANDYLQQTAQIDRSLDRFALKKSTKPVSANPPVGGGNTINLIDQLCGERQLRCLFLSGPLAEELINNFQSTIEQNNLFVQSTKNIRLISQVFKYPAPLMGDAEDHVATSSKKQVTQEYIEATKIFLK